VPGEDFVFEAQILISAARELGTRCVSVPIESRYQAVHADPQAATGHSPEQFRRSHFRPLRDFSRITSHVVRQSLRPLELPGIYRRICANPPLIHDPEGEFTPTAAQRATRTG
jgi:hypothetical protein